MRSLKSLILVAATLISLALFTGAYLTVSAQYRGAVADQARQNSELLSRQTFNSMYQVMRLGWSRAQLETFLEQMRAGFEGSSVAVDIIRGPKVDALFGTIAQTEPAPRIRELFARGSLPVVIEEGTALDALYPILARDECLACHVNAAAGDVLGVIEVRQELAGQLARAEERFVTAFLPIVPLALLIAVVVAMLLTRRLKRSILALQGNIESVNKLADLTTLTRDGVQVGIRELDGVVDQFDLLVERVRQIAVDRDLLEFEIRLLERFVITSEVVKDWREYIKRLLLDINHVLPAYALFSLFKMDEEQYELEVFWRANPSDRTRIYFEQQLYEAVRRGGIFVEATELTIRHNVAEPGRDLPHITPEELSIQTKSLLVERPKIGGIVGIGVNPDDASDQVRLLVVESILSTLLNMVGSIKAIYRYTQDLEYYATRDPLTHLYNQRLFWELLGYEIGRADRANYKFAVMVVDCDNFKSLNDTYGHGFGDQCLRLFADAIRSALRGPDILCRYGGDEFVAILPETGDAQPAAVGERVRDAIHALAITAPDGRPVACSVSIGVAVYPDHASESKNLFMFADNMMYRAKQEGKDRLCMPTPDDVVEVFKRIGEKGMMINNAIERRLVIPYFQPICTTDDGVVAAYEVLSRIDLSGGGEEPITAQEFVETAEQLGVIHKLDYICFEKAFEQVRETGYRGQLFLNLSPKNLVLKEFLHHIRKLVRTYDITPEQLVFEITERETVRNMSLLKGFIGEMRAEGYKFAIDDFGSGFSSFHYLKHFPIDYIKIEGDFVANMTQDEHDFAFVRSIAGLAAEIGITPIAEFIENREIYEAVQSCGVKLAQGFYLGRPQARIGSPPDGIGTLDAG